VTMAAVAVAAVTMTMKDDLCRWSTDDRQ